MKTFKTLLAIALLVVIASCSKKDDAPTPNPEVNPLAGYLATTGFGEKITNKLNSGDYEFGLSFKPIVNGKITAVVVKIPDVNANLRVTIWNKTTATVLKSEIINYATAGVEVTKAITPLEIASGTEYMVTFNSNDWYDYRRTAGTDATYPVTVGDISITGYSYGFGTAQTLPNSPQLNYYAGDISFKFQKS